MSEYTKHLIGARDRCVVRSGDYINSSVVYETATFVLFLNKNQRRTVRRPARFGINFVQDVCYIFAGRKKFSRWHLKSWAMRRLVDRCYFDRMVD